MNKILGRIDQSDVKEVKLDIKDKKILELLEENSRLTYTQIAKKIKLSRDAVRYRIERLKKLNVIKAFIPILSLKNLGYSQYHLFMQIKAMSEENEKKFIDSLINEKQVISIISYSDRWDLEIVIIAKTLEEFDKIITRIENINLNLVENTEMLIIVKKYNFNLLPKEFKEKVKSKIQNPKLDEKDFKLLKLLSKDARVPLPKISLPLKSSADAVGYRIKKLIKNNIIKKFSILTNLTNLGYSFYTLFIQLKSFSENDEKIIKQILYSNPNIIKAEKTIGKWDILMRIVAKEPEEFHQLIRSIRKSFGKNFEEYDTLLSYKEHKFEVDIL